MPGQFIGRYRILQEVGRGGMAIVYKGEDPTLERLVAIKLMPPKFLRNTDMRTRFKREAKVAARLDHPNIVKVYDVGEDEGSFHIVMEYLEGETLRDYIEQRKEINLDEVISFIRQMCLALDYAHSHKVVHRDIKPENIMVINRRIIKIMDFGLAFMDDSHSVTQAGAIMGTIAYFSPEQARGEPCDARSDLYSLGIIFFELLTGVLPFDATNPSDMIQKHLYCSPPSPLIYNNKLPRLLERILLRLLTKDPLERYQSAQEVLLELNKLSKRSQADSYEIPCIVNQPLENGVRFVEGVSVQREEVESKSQKEELQSKNKKEELQSKQFKAEKGSDAHVLNPEDADGQILEEDETLILEELRGLLSDAVEGDDLATLIKNEQMNREGLYGESWKRFKNILEKLKRERSIFGSGSQLSKSPEDTLDVVHERLCPKCNSLLPDNNEEECSKCKEKEQAKKKEKERLLEKQAKIAKREAQAHLDAAQAQYDKGLHKEALRLVLSALGINPKLVKGHYLHGCILRHEGTVKEALDAFNKCLELDPENAEVYERTGEIYFEEGRYEESLKHFRQSLLLEPARPDLYWKMAKVHQARGNLGESVQYLEQALKLDPNHYKTLKLYSIILIQQEEWDKAIETLELLLSIDPSDLEAYQLIGEIYEKTNRISIAMRYYEQALSKTFPDLESYEKDELNKENVAVKEKEKKCIETGEIHTRLGLLMERQNLLDHAREEYVLAVKNNPKNTKAHYRLAELYAIEKKVDLAINELEHVVGLEPNQSLAHYALGTLYLKQGKFDSAKLHLEWTIALDPFNADSHHKLGEIYYQGDKIEQAIKECKSAISLEPYNPEYHETLGMVYYITNQLEEAAEAIKKALTLDSGNADYHKALGIIHEGLKRYDLAIKEYGRAIELNPDDALAHGLLGKSYYESGLLNMAIYQYQKSVNLHPNSHLIHSLLGRAYSKQGRIDLAIDEFKKAIELAPKGDVKKSQHILGKAYKNLGAAYLEQGESQSAIDTLKTASNFLSKDAELISLLGNAYAEINDFDAAIPLLEEAIRQDPKNPKPYVDLALCLEMKDKPELAKRIISKGLELDPMKREFYELLGDMEERAGNNPSAILALKKCLELDGGQNDQYYWRLGRLYMEANQLLEAKEAYCNAIKLNKDNWHYYNDLAQVEEELGNLEEALKFLEQARLLNPDAEIIPYIEEALERLRKT